MFWLQKAAMIRPYEWENVRKRKISVGSVIFSESTRCKVQ